jgi:hypothetical protein
MISWLRRLLGGGTATTEPTSANRVSAGRDWEWDRADEYDYEHYTDAIEYIKQLKREKRHGEVIDLLKWCINYTEAEAEADEPVASAPATAYYRHLGIVLRKEGRYDDELTLLERYIDWFEVHGGEPREGLVDRLERARELASAD